MLLPLLKHDGRILRRQKNILPQLECLYQFIFISASLSCVVVAITWAERRSVGTIFGKTGVGSNASYLH
jgi:hypothetical protein